MENKKYIYPSLALIAVMTIMVASPSFASAAGNTSSGGANIQRGDMQGFGRKEGMRPGIFGTVTAVNGNTITISSKIPQKTGSTVNATTTTYTVDASNAKITKNNTTGTISSIAVNDIIIVEGTISGTNVTATAIRDGFIRNGVMNNMASSPITGNGQPVIEGTISAINGSTLNVTNNSNVSYTVDVTNAKLAQGPNTITVSGLATGDQVLIQGTFTGNSVTASSVIVQKAAAATAASSTTTETPRKGFFASIGSFFSHLFGF